MPINIAIGIVSPIVTMPQGLDLSAFTTISASTASRTIMIPSTATSAVDAGDRTDLLARHLAERLAVAADRGGEDHEVLHGAAECDADDDPDDAGQVAELRREGRPDQRSGAGDGREMVPKTIQRFVGT